MFKTKQKKKSARSASNLKSLTKLFMVGQFYMLICIAVLELTRQRCETGLEPVISSAIKRDRLAYGALA